MKTLTKEQAQTVLAFMDAFDIALTGCWPAVENYMRDQAGIDDPETALEEVRDTLQG